MPLKLLFTWLGKCSLFVACKAREKREKNGLEREEEEEEEKKKTRGELNSQCRGWWFLFGLFSLSLLSLPLPLVQLEHLSP